MLWMVQKSEKLLYRKRCFETQTVNSWIFTTNLHSLGPSRMLRFPIWMGRFFGATECSKSLARLRAKNARIYSIHLQVFDPFFTNTFPKFNSSPLKSYLPNRKVVFQPPFFRCYVKLLGGMSLLQSLIPFLTQYVSKKCVTFSDKTSVSVPMRYTHMGVSQSRGIPKWMVYNGKPY